MKKKSKKFKCHICGKKTITAIGNQNCKKLHCSNVHLELCKPDLKQIWYFKGWNACLREIEWRIIDMFKKNSNTPKGRYWSRNPFWVSNKLQEIIDKLKK